MAQNSSISRLDSNQMIKRVFDEANDAVRIVLGESTGIAIELSADDGDSIITRPEGISTKASLTSASSGVIIAAASCVGMKTFNLHSKTTSATVGPQVLTVEFSPHDSDDVWIASSITVTPSAVNGTLVSGTAASLIARRVRVSTAAAITSGTIDAYLIAQAV